MLAALLISALLDVPYLAQPPDLCGGAAVAMVMRYWGARDVFPQDFAPLVTPSDAGILTGTLTNAVRTRGWRGLELAPTSDDGHARIRAELDAGRPLIALIAVAPRTFHYIVIVGATDNDIVMHDPARAPWQVMPWTAFDRAWAAADRWLLLILPATDAPTAARGSPAPGTSTSPATPCSALVTRGVQLALDGAPEESERALLAAVSLCPADPAPLSELAGLRFSQQRWAEAREFASRATRLDPADAYAWQLHGAASFVLGRPADALTAWNRIGEPRIDLINIQGAVRTPQPVFLHAAGLEPRAVLTPSRLMRAERRLQDLPIANSAHASFTPLTDGAGDGRANVTIVVDERARWPRGRWTLASLATRALVHDELRVDVGGPLRAGDAAYVMWRWQSGRPRVEVGLDLPSPSRLPGVLSLNTAWERQSYAVPGQALDVETRRRTGLRLSDWATARVRWSAGAAIDRFNTRTYMAADGTLEQRWLGDRAAVSASGGWWTPLAAGRGAASASAALAWRSTTDRTRASLSVRADVSAVTEAAPRALWPGAGTGQGRAGVLRAHALVHDGVIDGDLFGRTVANSSAELARPWPRVPGGALAVAAFIDTARAWRRVPGLGASAFEIDAGLGLRLRAPGQRTTMRVDLARGLRRGGLTLSVSLTAGWPQ